MYSQNPIYKQFQRPVSLYEEEMILLQAIFYPEYGRRSFSGKAFYNAIEIIGINE